MYQKFVKFLAGLLRNLVVDTLLQASQDIEPEVADQFGEDGVAVLTDFQSSVAAFKHLNGGSPPA